MIIDSEYRLKLLDNLEKNNHYNDYFDKFKSSKLSVLDLYVYVELTTCPTDQIIEKEKMELRGQWQKDSYFHLTIFLWKKLCTIVSFNGIHESYEFKTIWFEDIPQFEKQLDKFMQIYYTRYIAKAMKIAKNTKLTKSRFEGWKGRAKAFKELREIKKIG